LEFYSGERHPFLKYGPGKDGCFVKGGIIELCFLIGSPEGLLILGI
jgi:hypothetical protein